MKKAVTFTLDEETIKKLRELSKETHIAQAKLANIAIDEFLDKKEREGEVSE